MVYWIPVHLLKKRVLAINKLKFHYGIYIQISKESYSRICCALDLVRKERGNYRGEAPSIHLDLEVHGVLPNANHIMNFHIWSSFVSGVHSVCWKYCTNCDQILQYDCLLIAHVKGHGACKAVVWFLRSEDINKESN